MNPNSNTNNTKNGIPAGNAVLWAGGSIYDATYTQNYNRYSYAWNNPLKYTDPSGYYIDGNRDYTPAHIYLNSGGSSGSWLSGNQMYMTGGFGPGSGRHWSDSFSRSWQVNILRMNARFFEYSYGTSVLYAHRLNKVQNNIRSTWNRNNTSANSGSAPTSHDATHQRYWQEGYGMSFDGEEDGDDQAGGGDGAVLKPYEPDFYDNWSESSNFFAKLSYDLVDGVAVTLQSFVLGPDSRHINGSVVVGSDRTDAFVNTASWGVLFAEAASFNAIKGGVMSSRWGLRIQAHSHSLSPLRGTGASGTMSPFHININNTHIITNPKYWKYYYKWP